MIRNVHILGSVQNIKIARDAVVSLILGSPPGTFSPEQSQNYVDVSRKGLRSFEVCWSEAQAAILDLYPACWLDLCVFIFGFSACSNDYLHDHARSLGL
jgi:rRNA processing protein Krr1/Pno1